MPTSQRVSAEGSGQRDANSLALLSMPSDSPGIGGDASSWEQPPVMLVSADGSLSPFDY